MNKWIVRVLGNFGVSFFSPLSGSYVASELANFEITATQMVMVSLIAALITTGLSISREAARYGAEKTQV